MKHFYIASVIILSVAALQAQQAVNILDANNIVCHTTATGDLFNPFDDFGLPGFEVPAGSGLKTFYAANFWFGGISPDQQLKLAAETYQATGTDWFSGPLTTDGNAAISSEVQLQYNKVWKAHAADVSLHQAYFNALLNGTVNEEFPNGYTIPAWFMDWPAHGDTKLNQAYYLAPFFDLDGNGVYEPANGDYPLFCGDQCLFFIFNDKGNIHSESGGQPIGLEVHAMLYAFDAPEGHFLDNTVFLRYKIINRGTQTLQSTRCGVFLDFDMGYPFDDYAGTNVLRSAVYGYNADGLDEPGLGLQGYGTDLPAQAFMVLAGPYMDADETDNALPDVLFSSETNSYGPYGFGFGDGIVDNERLGLSHSIYFENSVNATNGEPSTAMHYYNFMNGVWKSGLALTSGGNGTQNGNTPARYVYPGTSDPLFDGTNGVPVEVWTEVLAGNIPSDRRMVASCGPFTLSPGDIHYFDGAFVFARESDDDQPVLATLDQRLKDVRLHFNEWGGDCLHEVIPTHTTESRKPVPTASVFPNPMRETTLLRLTETTGTHFIQLADMEGRVLRTYERQGNGVLTIERGTLAPGIYHLSISEGAQRQLLKLVVL